MSGKPPGGWPGLVCPTCIRPALRRYKSAKVQHEGGAFRRRLYRCYTPDCGTSMLSEERWVGPTTKSYIPDTTPKRYSPE